MAGSHRVVRVALRGPKYGSLVYLYVDGLFRDEAQRLRSLLKNAKEDASELVEALGYYGLVFALVVWVLYLAYVLLRAATAPVIVSVHVTAVMFAWWRAVRLFPLARDSAPPSRSLVLCQISDLHLTRGDEQPYEITERMAHWPAGLSPPIGSELCHRLDLLLAEVQRLAPPLLVISGDMTDLGHPDEFSILGEKLSRLPPSTDILLVPGNHDVTINVATSPDFDLQKRREREDAFRDVLRKAERGPWLPDRFWSLSLADLFPRVGRYGPVRVIALDSNRFLSRHLFSNGIGLFGKAQLSGVQRELEQSGGPLVVVCHHHVARPIGTFARTDPLLIAGDGRALLEMLAAHNRRDPERNSVLLLHGHRHLDSLGEFRSARGGSVTIYGHPSSTLGHEHAGGRLDGQPRFAAIGLGNDGKWSVELHRLPVAGLEPALLPPPSSSVEDGQHQAANPAETVG